MNRHVVGLVALNDILRLVLRRMPLVAVEDDLGRHFLLNRPPNSSRLGIPFDMITALELSRHSSLVSLAPVRIIRRRSNLAIFLQISFVSSPWRVDEVLKAGGEFWRIELSPALVDEADLEHVAEMGAVLVAERG